MGHMTCDWPVEHLLSDSCCWTLARCLGRDLSFSRILARSTRRWLYLIWILAQGALEGALLELNLGTVTEEGDTPLSDHRGCAPQRFSVVT